MSLSLKIKTGAGEQMIMLIPNHAQLLNDSFFSPSSWHYNFY